MRVSKNIQQRLQLIASKRGIDQGEIKAALASERRLLKFAENHALSVDHLVLGDLRGLQRQTHARRRNAG